MNNNAYDILSAPPNPLLDDLGLSLQTHAIIFFTIYLLYCLMKNIANFYIISLLEKNCFMKNVDESFSLLSKCLNPLNTFRFLKTED